MSGWSDLYDWMLTRNVLQEVDTLFPEGEPGEATAEDGTGLHYITLGEGLPFVFCNGVVCTYTFFHFAKDYFRERCRMLFWDYRGHARSDVPDDLKSINMENHARDLAAVMDAAGMEKAVLLGHSMGVMVLLEFYHLFPERVKALVLLDGPYKRAFSLFCRAQEFHRFAHCLLGMLSRHTCLVSWTRPVMVLPIDFMVAKLVEVNPQFCPKKEMDLYFRNIVYMDQAAAFRALQAMSIYSAEDILPEVDVPSLVINGDKDDWAPMDQAWDMYEEIADSSLLVIPGGSHATPIEFPAMVNMGIDLFLRNHHFL